MKIKFYEILTIKQMFVLLMNLNFKSYTKNCIYELLLFFNHKVRKLFHVKFLNYCKITKIV